MTSFIFDDSFSLKTLHGICCSSYNLERRYDDMRILICKQYVMLYEYLYVIEDFASLRLTDWSIFFWIHKYIIKYTLDAVLWMYIAFSKMPPKMPPKNISRSDQTWKIFGGKNSPICQKFLSEKFPGLIRPATPKLLPRFWTAKLKYVLWLGDPQIFIEEFQNKIHL